MSTSVFSSLNSNDAAQFLEQSRNSIVQKWEEALMLNVSETTKHKNLLASNFLPGFLDELAEAFCASSRENNAGRALKSAGLDEQRRAAFVGESLDTLIHKYGLLIEIITETLEKKAPLDSEARRIFDRFFNFKIRQVAQQNTEIMKFEHRRLQALAETEAEAEAEVVRLAEAQKRLFDSSASVHGVPSFLSLC